MIIYSEPQRLYLTQFLGKQNALLMFLIMFYSYVLIKCNKL